MAHQVLQPKGWPRPPGYANGVVAQGRMVVLAGQIGWDAEGRLAEGLSAQIGQALANIVTLLREAGAGPEHLLRLSWYVTDMHAWREQQPAIGAAYREAIGKHFPAMSVIGVSELVEPEALVEIEAIAAMPDSNLS